MRRATVAAVVVAATLSLWPSGVAAAQADKNCSDFQTQQQAQAYYDLYPDDRARLDRDRDGRACEALPGRAPGSGEGPTPPSGGVETGAGGTATDFVDDGSDDGSPLLAPGLVGGAALAVGSLVLGRRRLSRRSD